MIAAGLGRTIDEIHVDIEPVVADDRVTGRFTTVEPGDVIGLRQHAGGHLDGGTHSDIATAAVIINTIARVVEAKPGLLTMMELPPARCVL